MASSSASEAPWEVTKKAKSIASRCSSFWRKDQHDDEVNPQLSSPLFTRLPQELRDRIWQFALEPPENANAAHFHICTYLPMAMRPPRTLFAPTVVYEWGLR